MWIRIWISIWIRISLVPHSVVRVLFQLYCNYVGKVRGVFFLFLKESQVEFEGTVKSNCESTSGCGSLGPVTQVAATFVFCVLSVFGALPNKWEPGEASLKEPRNGQLKR